MKVKFIKNIVNRLVQPAILLMALQLSVAAQKVYNPQSRDALLFQLKNSSPDANRLTLLHKLGNLYLVKGSMVGSHLFKEKINNEISLDSAALYYSAALSLSDSLHLLTGEGKYESLCLLGEIYVEKHNIPLAKYYFMPVIQAYQASGEKEKEADTWFRMIGNNRNWEKGNYSEIQNFINQSVSIYRNLGNKKKLISVLELLAYMHFLQGDGKSAGKVYLEMLSLSQSIGILKLHPLYQTLSTVYRYNGDFNKALSYAISCVKNMEETADTAHSDNSYGELALVYQELGQNEKSAIWYRKCLEKRIRDNRPQYVIYKTASLLVRQLIMEGNQKQAIDLILNLSRRKRPEGPMEASCLAQSFACCYESLKQYALAEKCYQEMIHYYEKGVWNDELVAIAYFDIAQFYVSQKQYEKAGYYLPKALNVPAGTNTLSRVRDIHLLLFKIDSAAGRYISAIDHLEQSRAVNDSMFSSDKSRQIEELQIRYETEQKEQNIKLLQKESQIVQNRFRLTLGGIVFLFIFIGVISYGYRLKQKNNRQLEQNQTEINQKNISLQHLLNEKEWLVKEIHHRVKNNFHIVMGLLGTQSGYLKNEEAILAMTESQHRIQAMALIHQKLYQSENLSAINMANYIHELVEYLKDSFDVRRKIQFNLEIVSMVFDLSYAIPLGLILNEAITNCIKHAFREINEGSIRISLQRTREGKLQMMIADNGIGIPSGFDPYKRSSMGMNLIQGLSEDIGGTFFMKSIQGTQICITFTHDADQDKPQTSRNINQTYS